MFGIKSYLLRNNKSFGGEKSPKRKIILEYWKSKVNIGDALAPVIYEYMMKRNGLSKDVSVSKRIHLMTVGSLIGLMPFDAVIWGTGIHRVNIAKNLINNRKKISYDIRAIRGPVTKFVMDIAGYQCPDVFGDPAVLMKLIYQPENVKKEYDVSVIYHLFHKNSEKKEGIHYIDTQTDDYNFFINEIIKSKLIISSSLHGIILAETYGIPAIFLSEGMEEEIIKYFDWYYSTGRCNIKMALSLEEALSMEPMEIPDLEAMRKSLIDSFPADLWDKTI